jgi:hypothetical protein
MDGKKHLFFASDTIEREKWMEDIQKMIDEHHVHRLQRKALVLYMNFKI